MSGPARLRRHLEAEYGPAAAAEVAGGRATDIGLEVTSLSPQQSAPVWADRHKTTIWRTHLTPPSERPIRLGVAVRGAFGPSLVQSLAVEPLLSIALAERGTCLLSGAGIVVDGRAVAICGRSRSGKSTLALRAWAAGRSVLSDDHLRILRTGEVAGFRRRLRIYPDLRSTAPAATRRLGGATRARLVAVDVVRRASAGWIGLPVLLDPSGVIDEDARVPLGAVVVIDRSADAGSVRHVNDPARAWPHLDAVVQHDLRWVARRDAAWQAATETIAAGQLDLLRAAIRAADARLSVLVVPAAWPAPRAIDAIAEQLSLD